jgi:arginyl-tRNA synthetase
LLPYNEYIHIFKFIQSAKGSCYLIFQLLENSQKNHYLKTTMHDNNNFQSPWKIRIAGALNALITEAGITADMINPGQIIAEIPPDPAMGDIGFPMFSYAKMLRKGPPQIAQMVCQWLKDRAGDAASEKPDSVEANGIAEAEGFVEAKGFVEALGPYVNVRLDRPEAARIILAEVFNENFGRPGTFAGKKVMVEFSSPNTNKPLHLGHLRNDELGESVSRILEASGADVRKVCIINDRGIHICKSMLAYKEQGQGATPESEKIKSDHFVGKWYVCFSRDLKQETEELMQSKGLKKEEAEAQSPLMARAQDLLRKWEAGDAETTELWKLMNSWAVEGMKKTYQRTGISFDQYYYESNTWQLGKEEVLKGLERGIFYREADGAVAVDLSAEKLDKKILLRSDGTSIYITQDFGTAINRYKDFPFDQMIYVVGSEQQYHFKVLFVLLDKLG